MASAYKDHLAWLFEEPWLFLIGFLAFMCVLAWLNSRKQPPEPHLTDEEFLAANNRALYPELFEFEEEEEEPKTEPTPEDWDSAARHYEDLARQYEEWGMPQDAKRFRALAAVNRGYEGAMEDFHATLPGPESVPEDPRWLRLGLALTKWARPREEKGP